jgi:hypothetical protein
MNETPGAPAPFKSANLRHTYAHWAATADPAEAAFVDSVYALCEDSYSYGGDVVVECFAPADVLRTFNVGDLNAVREFCGLRLEAAANARWGEDDDPELRRLDEFGHGEW